MSETAGNIGEMLDLQIDHPTAVRVSIIEWISLSNGECIVPLGTDVSGNIIVRAPRQKPYIIVRLGLGAMLTLSDCSGWDEIDADRPFMMSKVVVEIGRVVF